MTEDQVTSTLPAAAVDSDAVLHITTAGDQAGLSSIHVRSEGGAC